MAIHTLIRQLQAAGAAFQLLTRVPIPVQIPFTPAVLARSTVYYPVVGLVVGWMTAAAAWLFTLVLPAWPAAVLTLIVWVALSGALHLDGLMDTADGVLSHRSRDRMLEIMKDSRVGAMGVIAAVLLLMLKASLLASLLDAGGAGSERWGFIFIIVSCMMGRTWLVAAITCWPSARKHEGMGAMFLEANWKHLALAAGVLAVLTVLVFRSFGMNWTIGLQMMMLGTLLMVITGLILATWLNKKLGGLTGDTYGAMNEAVETVILLLAVWWLN